MKILYVEDTDQIDNATAHLHVGKLLLAHLEHQAAHTNPAADVVVDGVLGIWVRASGLQAALALSTILPQAREALPETREPVARDIRGGMIPNHAT